MIQPCLFFWVSFSPVSIMIINVIAVLNLISLLASSIAWSIVKQFTLLKTLLVCLTAVLRDFLLFGVIAATIFWSVFLLLSK